MGVSIPGTLLRFRVGLRDFVPGWARPIARSVAPSREALALALPTPLTSRFNARSVCREDIVLPLLLRPGDGLRTAVSLMLLDLGEAFLLDPFKARPRSPIFEKIRCHGWVGSEMSAALTNPWTLSRKAPSVKTRSNSERVFIALPRTRKTTASVAVVPPAPPFVQELRTSATRAAS